MTDKRVIDLSVILVSVAIFLALSIYHLDLPGLYYDEAADAVPAMQLLAGQKVELVNNMGLAVGNLTLPVMVMDYVGAVNTYLLLPFFALFGVGTLSLRMMTVSFGALTILLGYLLARDLFNRPVAAATSLLLAVNPSFVFWTRQGIHVSSVMTAITMGSWLCFLRWHRANRTAYLSAGFFLLGLGLSTKILYLWVIIALAAAYFLIAPRRALGIARRRTRVATQPASLARDRGVIPRATQYDGGSSGVSDETGRRLPLPLGLRWYQLIVAVALFCAGAWMILLYNLKTQGTINYLLRNLQQTDRGVNNLAFVDNLGTQLKAFATVLRGDQFWFLGGWFANDWYVPVFVASLVTLVLIFAFNRAARVHLRAVAFIVLFIALILIQSCFTVSILGPTHLLVLLPLPQMIVAVTVFLLWQSLRRWRPVLIGGLAILALLLALDLGVDLQYHNVLEKTGGWMSHSDAIYRLSSYLEKRGVPEPMAMDWGIKTSVQIVTQGRINPIEIFQYDPQPNETFLNWLYGALTQRPNTVYIFHADDATFFPRFEAFQELANKLDKKVWLEQTIVQRDGRVLFKLYSVQP